MEKSIRKQSIVLDLDDTICFPDHNQTDTFLKYGRAKPNSAVIEKVRELHLKGWYIIINSARRMLTHSGDISKIEADVSLTTKVWLRDNGVPYDELIFGKPYSSSYYVDDKAMTIEGFINWRT